MDYVTISIFLLAFLQIKHWYVDFVNQTTEEIKFKGVYLDWRGIKHSLKHGLGTFLIVLLFAEPGMALAMACLDFLIHYHIDYFKMKYGSSDMSNPKFWKHFGLDQMAHQFCYLLIAFILV